MINIQKDYINGWNSPTKEELSKLSRITVDNQFDSFGSPQWKWPDYPDGEPVFSPQPYTPEQLETLRKQKCRQDIRAQYTEDEELQILREALQAINARITPEYETYNNAIKGIIEDSKKIDFSAEAETKEIL